jgi:hypothetical protein
LPAPVLKLLRQITGAANGTSNTPPRMRISTAYGVLMLEAKWLVPTGTLPPDAAKDPKSCLISVTIELHEHAIAHPARILRESGATPTQIKVGIQLVFGKPKPVIADESNSPRSRISRKGSIRLSMFTIPPSSARKSGLAKNTTQRAKVCGAPVSPWS